MKGRGIRVGLLAGLLLMGLVVIPASLMIGAESIPLAEVWREWRSGAALRECPMLSILLHQRLPRTLAAFMAGGTLALVGCSFQALLRNPLATPYTLGIASFGAFGAWVATVLVERLAAAALGWVFSPVQMGAFLFAAFDVLVIYLLAARHPRMAPSVLLLTGVTMGMLANAGIMLMRFLALPDQLYMMDRWLMGGVDVLGYGQVRTLFFGTIPCCAVLLLQASKFDQLGFGTELAASRGVHVKRLQAVTFLVGSLATAIVASTVGPIGFVGLIVPHAIRAVTGSRHRLLMPITVLVGGGFLCLCDIIARRIFTGETPIGIVTALFGGPFFLYLLTRHRFTDWET